MFLKRVAMVSNPYKQYQRTTTTEMRPVTSTDTAKTLLVEGVSISDVDFMAGSPKLGDFIARTPNNHKDKWLVAAAYANDNFKLKG